MNESEIQNLAKNIKSFPVNEYAKQIEMIGNARFSFENEGRTYALGVQKEPLRPILLYKDFPRTKDGRVTTLIGSDSISWPMRRPGTKGSDSLTDFQNGLRFRCGGVANPKVHPQFVFLGENFSGTVDLEDSDFCLRNGYCEQADIVTDTILSGGYFTDFLKGYEKTHLAKKDIEFFRSTTESGLSWFQVYLEIFKNELKRLKDSFNLSDKCPRYIFVWGIGTYRVLNKLAFACEGKTFEDLFDESEGKVLILGLHYSRVGRTPANTFPDDRRWAAEMNKDAWMYSSVRAYTCEEKMTQDRLSGKDERNYEFALIDGVLRPTGYFPSK